MAASSQQPTGIAAIKGQHRLGIDLAEFSKGLGAEAQAKAGAASKTDLHQLGSGKRDSWDDLMC
jgi:hypothetical protein